MATLMLDLDLQQLPPVINVPERYHQALILIRLKGQPVGQTLLPVRGGCFRDVELHNALVEAVDWPLWARWLKCYLGLDQTLAAQLPPATIAICTRDRTEDLRRCLDSLMALPDDGQEILVIDNCPATDATRQLIDHYPQVRYVREDRPGLNIARNRALREARHDIIAFTDDDTVTDPAWLRSLLRNFDSPQVLCVTGLTMPLELETEAQEWSERYCPFGRGFNRVVYDVIKLNPLAAGRVGAGANMALRRTVSRHVGPFDEALDAGTPTRSGGDTEMFSRILAAGYQIIYDPAALSWHRHRRSWPELRHMLYGYGVGAYAIWTRKLFVEGDLTVPKLAWQWFYHDQLPGLLKALFRRPNCVPQDLLLAELKGCFVGPWAYWQSRRRLGSRSS